MNKDFWKDKTCKNCIFYGDICFQTGRNLQEFKGPCGAWEASENYVGEAIKLNKGETMKKLTVEITKEEALKVTRNVMFKHFSVKHYQSERDPDIEEYTFSFGRKLVRFMVHPGILLIQIEEGDRYYNVDADEEEAKEFNLMIRPAVHAFDIGRYSKEQL